MYASITAQRDQPCVQRSLRQAAKASVLHTDIPRFESWSEHHRPSPVAQRQSARPITGRPRFDTVRENQKTERDQNDEHQTGAACRRMRNRQWTWSVQA
jgi:hypothetical protein